MNKDKLTATHCRRSLQAGKVAAAVGRRSSSEGMALVSVTILLLVVLALGGLMATRAVTDKSQTDQYVYRERATAAAEGGIDLAIRAVWNDYLLSDPVGDGSAGTLANYLAYVADFAPNNEDTNGNGTQDAGETDSNADGVFSIATPHELLTEPRTLPNGARIESVTVERNDDATGTRLTIRSRGEFGGVQRTAVQSVRVGGELFKGFGFALLANNINCIMCHADFDNVNRINNTDPAKRGTFDRVRIASLESLLVRVGSADSTLAGTYYTRGIITDKQGNPLSTLAGSTFSGWDFDSDGKIIESSTGAMASVELTPAVAGGDGLFQPLEHLYTSYPTLEEEMVDGELPTSFPPAIPDLNGNKAVDDSEFAAVTNTFSQGRLEGGIAYGLPSGATYSDTSLPSAGNAAYSALSSSGYYNGNLFLVGTPSNPIVLNGKIAIDGDVIISGPVKGTGQIFARRNIYFVGDTTYADAPGAFGSAADASENLAAYVAGGNIIIGDYLTPKGVTTTTTDSKGKKKTTTSDFDVTSAAYLTTAGLDPGGPANSGASASFTMSELTLFNRMEYSKAQNDPNYTPRYYRLRPGDPIYRFTGSGEHGDKYDSTFTSFTPPANATVLDISPDAGWVSELQLKQFWRNDEQARSSAGSPFRIDGLLYTNNAIFALARSNNKHKSRTFGQIIVRGGLIAADVGILAPGDNAFRGFTMHYDDRVRDFLGIEDVGNLTFTRLVQLFVSDR